MSWVGSGSHGCAMVRVVVWRSMGRVVVMAVVERKRDLRETILPYSRAWVEIHTWIHT